jgi:phosphate transport system substrate-binding protein
MSQLKHTATAVALVLAAPAFAQSRENVQVAGPSTVLPSVSILAEAFGENSDVSTPVVESGGSGAGRQRFCEGVGQGLIDVANSSSRITQNDLDACAANGVTDTQEVRFGYDGIVFASAVDGPAFALTPADVFNALAARVVVDGQVVDNSHTTRAQ